VLSTKIFILLINAQYVYSTFGRGDTQSQEQRVMFTEKKRERERRNIRKQRHPLACIQDCEVRQRREKLRIQIGDEVGVKVSGKERRGGVFDIGYFLFGIAIIL
jgi:hypothetical protein